MADANGDAKFSYQTTSPAGLGLDLDYDDPNITVLTSYWSGQVLGVSSDSSLSG